MLRIDFKKSICVIVCLIAFIPGHAQMVFAPYEWNLMSKIKNYDAKQYSMAASAMNLKFSEMRYANKTFADHANAGVCITKITSDNESGDPCYFTDLIVNKTKSKRVGFLYFGILPRRFKDLAGFVHNDQFGGRWLAVGGEFVVNAIRVSITGDINEITLYKCRIHQFDDCVWLEILDLNNKTIGMVKKTSESPADLKWNRYENQFNKNEVFASNEIRLALARVKYFVEQADYGGKP